MVKKPELSLVIPVFNEETSLSQLCQEITSALEPSGKDYEVIFVDDGSTDDSFKLLSNLRQRDSRIRVVRFRKNFGQTAALDAGFLFAPVGTLELEAGCFEALSSVLVDSGGSF